MKTVALVLSLMFVCGIAFADEYKQVINKDGESIEKFVIHYPSQIKKDVDGIDRDIPTGRHKQYSQEDIDAKRARATERYSKEIEICDGLQVGLNK